MSSMRDPDERPTELPDTTRLSIMMALPATRQARRRSSLGGWVAAIGIGRLAVAALLVAVVVGVGFKVRDSWPAAGSPPVPTVATFTSPQYAYSVQVPTAWSVTSAIEPWTGGDGIEGSDRPFADIFGIDGSASAGSAEIKAESVPDGLAPQGWLVQWETTRAIGGHCFGSASPWTSTHVNGFQARRFRWRCDNPRDALSNYDEYALIAGGMGYVISGAPSMVELLVHSFRVP